MWYVANIPRLRAVVYGHIPQIPEAPYCDYKLVTNVIRTVNSIVLSYVQHPGIKPPGL